MGRRRRQEPRRREKKSGCQWTVDQTRRTLNARSTVPCLLLSCLAYPRLEGGKVLESFGKRRGRRRRPRTKAWNVDSPLTLNWSPVLLFDCSCVLRVATFASLAHPIGLRSRWLWSSANQKGSMRELSLSHVVSIGLAGLFCTSVVLARGSDQNRGDPFPSLRRRRWSMSRARIFPAVVQAGRGPGNLFRGETHRRRGIGSGVIIDDNRAILTNFHVAGRAAEIDVTLFNKERVPAI